MKKTPESPISDKQSFPEVTLTEFRGVQFLHFGTDWIQGAMRLKNPYEIVLDYVQQMMVWMLFKDKPEHIVQLGLGSAALTKFCYQQFPDTRVTAVELNPEVINICRKAFHLPEDNHRLSVLQTDAFDYIESKKGSHEIDIIQVDLYDENAAAPVFDSPEFYLSCADVLAPDGMMTVYIFGNDSNRTKSIEAIKESFDSVVWLPEIDGGNIVILAFKKSPEVDFEVLYQRAKLIKKETKLKAVQWVNALQDWMKNT